MVSIVMEISLKLRPQAGVTELSSKAATLSVLDFRLNAR